MKLAFTDSVLSSIEIHAPYAEREDESFMGQEFVDRHETLQRVAKLGEASPDEARAVVAALSDIMDVEPRPQAAAIERAISKIMTQLAEHDSSFSRVSSAYPAGSRVRIRGVAERTFQVARYNADDVKDGKIRIYITEPSTGPGTLIALNYIEAES